MRVPKKDTFIPSDKDIQIAKESSRILSSLLDKKHSSLALHYLQSKDSESVKMISLPDPALRLLLDILIQMSKGNTVTIRPLHAELTTQEAADILNVSRPFIIKQLEEGKLSYKMVGTRRKLLLQDVIEYKESMYRARMKSLDKLTKDAQDLDMGY